MSDAVITVSNATQLMSALAGATGGETILLQAGNYGGLDLENNEYIHNTFVSNYASAVTIKSASPDDPAVFTSLWLDGVKNLSFDSIKFDYTAAAGTPDWARPFNVQNCTGITITNSVFDGALDYTYSTTGTGTGNGLSVSSSQNVTINNNEFFNWCRAAVFGDDTNLNVTGNDVHDIRSDGFDFANVDNVLIENNYIHDFVLAVTSHDHPDMIQFFTTGTTSPSTNIVIRGNVLDSGTGGVTQSIFMRNEAVDYGNGGAAMFYQNILIEDNVIYNAVTHGITVGETDGLTIQNNTILTNLDFNNDYSTMPTIHVAAASTEVVVINNILPRVVDVAVAGALIANNVIVQSDNPDGANYVGDLFVDALAGANATLADLQAIPGGILMGVGSSLTSFSTQPAAPVGFIVDDASAGLSLLTHSLDASNLYGPSGQINLQGASVVWNFGDGTTASGVTVNHAFAHAGSYDVTATITLASGTLVQFDKTIAVQTPVALRADFNNGAQDLSDITNPVTVTPSVTFEAGASGQAIRLNGGLVTYQNGPELLNNAEYTLLFDFKKDPGQESAAGRVINFPGSVVVMIESNGITAAINTEQSGEWLTVSNIGINDADWHTVALTFSAAAGTATLYVDGAAVGRVDGLSGIQAGSPYQPFSIGDPSGGGFPGLIDNVAFLKGSMSAQQISAYTASPSDFDLLLPPPVNDAPVTLASIAEDGASRLITQANLLVGVTDVDGPNLSITALSIQSGKGTLINNSNGTWSYTPAINDDGSVTFSYSASDGTQTASSTATLDIIPVNDAPVASPVTLASIAEDGASRLITQANLLIGVTDVDGPNLSIMALSIQSGKGTLINNSNGTWSYTPAINDDGSVTFSYSASDGTQTASSTATLDITPVYDAPVAPPVLDSIAEDGASRLITQAYLLLVGVTDVDVSIQSGKGTLSIQHGVMITGGGEVTLSDDAWNVISGTGVLSNVDNVISGAGQLGGGQLALANAGTIAATGTQSLVIDAGANTIENSGTLESRGSGGLVINSNLENSGVVWANGGNVSFNGAVTGSGDLLVNGSATVEFAGAASIDTQLAADAMATLIMHDSFNFSGVVSGFDGNDRLDLTDISFTNGVTLGYSASQDGSGGVLQVSDGAHTAIISVLGQYDASGFSTSADNSTGTVVTYDPHHFLV